MPMPDRDDLGGAWRVPPSQYLERRPPTRRIPAPRSCYVKVRDGVKLAVDYYVPGDGERFPTIVILTPYYRRFALTAPREREDHREIADWIVRQPWSNGVIGSTGISYLGAAACFLASTGHPAVKAIAPLFAVSDTYSDHVFPG